MAKQTFNEAESFLLDSWEQARAFEEAMTSVRQKYKTVAERILKAAEEHPGKFDRCDEYVANDVEGGSIAFGRRAWVTSDNDYVAGLWLCNIGLDSLLSPSAEAPWASLWGTGLFATREEGNAKRNELMPQLKKILPPELGSGLEPFDMSRSSFVGWSFSSKKDLLAGLREGDSDKFQKIILEQLDIFETMLRVIEPIFIKGKSSKK